MPEPSRLALKCALEATVRVKAIIAFLVITTLAAGQSASPKSFEVASIKSSAPLTGGLSEGLAQISNRGAKIDRALASFTGLSLLDLIARAYRLETFQVAGPDWMNTARFDIVAKLPEQETVDSVPEMLQSLLIERFGLKAHSDSKEFQVHILRVGEEGPRVPASGKPDSKAAAADYTSMSMTVLATWLSGAMGHPVLNQTGMENPYLLPRQLISRVSLRLSWQKLGASPELEATMSPPSEGEIVKSLYAAGLLLEPRKLPLTLLVIDHLERTPKEN